MAKSKASPKRKTPKSSAKLTGPTPKLPTSSLVITSAVANSAGNLVVTGFFRTVPLNKIGCCITTLAGKMPAGMTNNDIPADNPGTATAPTWTATFVGQPNPGVGQCVIEAYMPSDFPRGTLVQTF